MGPVITGRGMVQENRCPAAAATGLKGMTKELQAFGGTHSGCRMGRVLDTGCRLRGQLGPPLYG